MSIAPSSSLLHALAPAASAAASAPRPAAGVHAPAPAARSAAAAPPPNAAPQGGAPGRPRGAQPRGSVIDILV
jgi:hypothetical protein